MSGLYIPGMEMPKDRAIIEIHPAGGYACTKYGFVIGRVIELPPHGRLGDLGKLEFAFNESAEGLHGTPKWAEVYRECAKAVREAETIIPASGGADNG